MNPERTPQKLSHADLVARMLANPEVRAEYERLENEEMVWLDMVLNARLAAGLTQAQVAERMGIKAPTVARLERALATGKPSPSLETLRKYVHACGKELVISCR